MTVGRQKRCKCWTCREKMVDEILLSRIEELADEGSQITHTAVDAVISSREVQKEQGQVRS